MANIIKRRPFTELMSLRNDLDRFFNEAFRFFDEDFSQRLAWKPAVDVEETADYFLISAELPGLNKEDIKISIIDNRVVLSGEISEEKEVREANYYLKERSRGKFSRSITLPSPVNTAGAEATYKDGILSLKLPKAEEAKMKEIKIK
ncbi:MAG: Hsp20/alpha crystallin family protein [Firmicutes bacterium]|jgi:HSP20 family protein|nr:Hsp20/alpha crystallin family protein [Bacillota bacterium]NLL58905.1 Hsp20/alpha crystallin family protein [Bacillota bacterium]